MIYPKAIINLKNFAHNINYVQSLIGDSFVCPVIKSNAYGHGYEKISQTLNEIDVKCVGVATIKELKQIIKLGFNFNVLHLGRISSSNIDFYSHKKIILTINSIEDIEIINSLYKGDNNIRCHLKIDTGMSRMGCSLENYEFLIKQIKKSNKITLEGIYTHLACSENKNSDFNKIQLESFEKIINNINDKSLNYHILNSGGVFNFSKYKFDFVRTGIALYGISPLGQINSNLKPVMELKAPIVLIKTISPGTSIGYGCTYRAEKKMKIGIVQCGYADGIPLNFSNKGFVHFDNEHFPIVGKVSMDLISVDFTKSHSIKLMDEVTIWGGANEESRLELISKKVDSIPYIFLTSLSDRVKRIYVEK